MLRPLHDWLLIELEPLPEDKVGAIHVIGSALQRVRAGKVLRVGPGRTQPGRVPGRIPVDVVVGERVAFFRENFETQQGKQVAHVLEQFGNVGLIRETSILYKWVGEIALQPEQLSEHARARYTEGMAPRNEAQGLSPLKKTTPEALADFSKDGELYPDGLPDSGTLPLPQGGRRATPTPPRWSLDELLAAEREGRVLV
jgi:co-chaperonin GroES (HSP10)